MRTIRFLTCAALLTLAGIAAAQTNQLSIDVPNDGAIISDCVQFSISHTDISPGLGLRLVISRDGTGETKNISGPTFPDGGLTGLWPPCADFRVGGPFPDGPYTAVAQIYDLITNAVIFSDTIHFTMDRTKPTVTMSLNPDKPVYDQNDTNVQLQITATDASGFRSWTLDYHTVHQSGGPENSPFNKVNSIDMSTIPDGVYDITFECLDKAGFVPPGECFCGPNVETKAITFTVRKQPEECDCVILPNLIWRTAQRITDPFDGQLKQSFRPEVLNIDDVTIRDILDCHGVPVDENLIVQAVCASKTTPYWKCTAFVSGPGSGVNTNFDTGLRFADSTMIDDSVLWIAFGGRLLGDRCLLFSPPDTTYILCVVYVVRDPVTGRTGPPQRKELCWKVEIPDRDVIRCNIEYFSTVAVGATQKCKITEDVAAALNACLDITSDLEALICFETTVALFAVDFPTFLGWNGGDLRFVSSYLIDSDEEPVGCLLIEQANAALWHP